MQEGIPLSIGIVIAAAIIGAVFIAGMVVFAILTTLGAAAGA
jgi:hypothetical protein